MQPLLPTRNLDDYEKLLNDETQTTLVSKTRSKLLKWSLVRSFVAIVYIVFQANNSSYWTTRNNGWHNIVA